MTTYNSMTTRAAGYVVPSTEWNKIVNNFDACRQVVGLVRRAAALAINNTSDTAITFDTQDVDDENYIDIAGNPTRITLPRDGNYLFDVEVQFESNNTGYRYVNMPRSGGASDFQMNFPAINGAITVVKFPFITGNRTAGDWYEIVAYQNSGGALNITARVAVTMICDRT